MTTERCECCDLPAYSCGKAKETAQLARERRHRERLAAFGWRPATYAGACSRCGEHFEPGALIRHKGVVEGYGWLASSMAKAPSVIGSDQMAGQTLNSVFA